MPRSRETHRGQSLRDGGNGPRDTHMMSGRHVSESRKQPSAGENYHYDCTISASRHGFEVFRVSDKQGQMLY